MVDVYEDEFGEVSWELKPEMVFWKIAASVVDPTCILGAVIDGGIPNKLYVLCRLLLSGWLLSDDIPNEYNLASPRHLNRRILSLPLSFSMALDCLEDVVGRKGLDAIRTGCCDGYYKALWELEDLRSFHALEDFVAFQNKHFLLWPKGNPCLHWMTKPKTTIWHCMTKIWQPLSTSRFCVLCPHLLMMGRLRHVVIHRSFSSMKRLTHTPTPTPPAPLDLCARGPCHGYV